MIEPVGDHSQSQGFGFCHRSLTRLAVDDDARQVENLCDPTLIGFLFDFDSHARRIARPTAMSQASKRCQRPQGGKSGYCRHAPQAPGGSWWGDAGRPLKSYSSPLLFTGACSWLTGIGVNAPGHVPRGVAHLSRMP